MTVENNGKPPPGLHLAVEAGSLEPLIAAVIDRTIARIDEARGALAEKLAYSEAEAARLLSLHTHQLRDARLRGEIQASVGPGRKILYARGDLVEYLAGRRWTATAK
ncbi:MAG: helix-turn-helix domain-containing protein [Gemmataceae bacterium]